MGMKKVGRVILSAALLGGLATPSPAIAQSGGRLEYAVKFVCGVNLRPSISPAAAVGAYFTAINIHNPLSDAAPLVHKVALAEPGRPTRPSPITSPFRLGYDEAVEIDCPQIARLLASAGIPARAVLHRLLRDPEPDRAGRGRGLHGRRRRAAGAVTSMHTERVPVRRRGG